MAKQYKIGMVDVLLGNIESDGGMSLTLSAIGSTVADSPAFTTADPTKQDFNIEEQDTAVYSIQTLAGKKTFAWSCYDINAQIMVQFFGGTVAPPSPAVTAKILTLGSITPGSAYTNGVYNAVPLTGGSGTGATANITVAGGVVTDVALVNRGAGYAVANTLSAVAANIGGTGTGFTVPVATIGNTPAAGETWKAPSQDPTIEKSIKLVWKNGGYVLIPRASITAKLELSFKKSALSKIDLVADILVPTKTDEPSMSIIYS